MMRNIKIIYLILGLVLIGAAVIDAGDLAGKWFSKTGDHIITIFKSGPEYSAAIPKTEEYGNGMHFVHSLDSFDVNGNSVRFKISDRADGSGVTIFDGAEYTLRPSEDGSRLIGRRKFTNIRGKVSDESVTLFLRNE